MHQRKGKKTPQQLLQDRYEKGDPEVGLLGEPSGKFDFYVLYPKSTLDFDPVFPTPPPDDWGEKPPPPPPKAYKLSQKPSASCRQQILPPLLPTPPVLNCCMFTPGTPSYKEEFPPMEDFELPHQNTRHAWKIKTPAGKNQDGSPKRVSPAEATLNWQSENAIKQNAMLSKLLDGQTRLQQSVHTQMHSLTDLIQDCRSKIEKLKEELSHIARTVKNWY